MDDPHSKATELRKKHGLDRARAIAWGRLSAPEHSEGGQKAVFWGKVVKRLDEMSRRSAGKPKSKAQKRKMRRSDGTGPTGTS